MTSTESDLLEKAKTKRTNITVEDVARYPFPGFNIPVHLSFSPDNRLLSYLFSQDGSLTRQLFVMDMVTGEKQLLVKPHEGGDTEENLSLEEKLRRERLRQLGLGVTHYSWAKKTDRLLIPLEGNLYIQDGLGSPLRKIIEGDGKPLLDPQISPDGKWVAYVQDSEIFIINAESGKPRRLTFGAIETGRTNGLAEFVAQEEMNRSHGFWWSPDSKYIAFTEVDETHIPLYRIEHLGKDEVGAESQEAHRYPFAGKENAKTRLGVVSIEGGQPVWMNLGENGDIYLARVGWMKNGFLSAQIENRTQTELDIIRFNPSTGEGTLLLKEINETWINLHEMLSFLEGKGPGGDGFIWASERTGFRHLYLYSKDGNLVRPLTSGEWMVETIAGVDEENGRVYFTATKHSALERHLYVVPLTGGEPLRLTEEPGTHSVLIDHTNNYFVDSLSSIENPYSIKVRSLTDGSVLHNLYEEVDPRIDQIGLVPPEMVKLESREGVTLFGVIYRPPSEFGQGPYPTIVSVYGGPHAQNVTNSWRMTVAMRRQYLRNQGYLVFVLDNQGSAGRGLVFEGAIKNDMGNIEVQDQVDGVKWLISEGLTDSKRVGIYGGSYGGYVAAMCLAKAPDTFKIAIADAPVADWDGYDTHYTERYMGTPLSNPKGYTNSSVLSHVESIRGKLMLIHGLIDENVHFRHTARIINALIRARVAYDLLIFPDERHSPRKLVDRVYKELRINNFIRRNL